MPVARGSVQRAAEAVMATPEVGFPGPIAPRSYLRAAQYLRMSTDRQQYSIQNQAEALQQYAALHSLLIVRTYADEGRSGLTVRGRPALSQLLAEVQSGAPPFEVLLIYDVSRWGRFQDADEGAYYEHMCRRAGVTVVYCAESFGTDTGPMSSIVKAMKRVMAGEYSRELSHKIWVGQSELIRRGFKAGGPAVFGLRRMMVDKDGKPKAVLERGETKALQNDRVVYVLGPPVEVEAVRRVFRLFVKGWNLRELANMLNEEGLFRPSGRRWYGDEVRRLLRCESYIGNNVYNRRSRKLKQKEIWNPPEEWIRFEGGFEPIISREVFEKARKLLNERAALYDKRRSRTIETMLEEVRALVGDSGKLDYADLNRPELRFKGDAYRQQLGGVLKIRQRLGLSGPRDRHFLVDVPARRALRQTLIDEIQQGFEARGVQVDRQRSPRLVVGGQFSVLVHLTQSFITPKRGDLRWTVRFDRVREADAILIARLNHEENTVRDFLLMRTDECPGECLTFGLEEVFDQFRLPCIDAFFDVRCGADIARVRPKSGQPPLERYAVCRKPHKLHWRARARANAAARGA